MRVSIKRVENMTQAEVDRCDHLNMGFRYGMMKARFRGILENPENSFVVLAREQEKIVGWALIFQSPPKINYIVYMYIHKDWRRAGIGTRIMKAILKWQTLAPKRDISVCPWDAQSDAFYSHWPKIKRTHY